MCLSSPTLTFDFLKYFDHSEESSVLNSAIPPLPISFTAPVLHGKKLGRRLGAPTLNQKLPQELGTLPLGVYFSRCFVGGIFYNAVTNIGKAPTVTENGEITAESHLFGLSEPVYGESVETQLLFFRRPEKKFESTEELAAAIGDDISAALDFFTNNKSL